MAQPKIMIYGANGFTARLFLHKLAALPCEIILAGRNEVDIAALAQQHGYRHRIFGLTDINVVDKHLSDIALVLNCAGPFTKTAVPLAKSAIRNRCHYFDITGELRVFEALHRMHDDARANNVCLIAGMGFDIVPSDCLARALAERMPDAERLKLAIITKNTAPSHGTLKTAFLAGSVASPTEREGATTTIYDTSSITIPLRGRNVTCYRAPLADLFCAHLSTGIANIETYLALPKQFMWLTPALKVVKALSRRPFFYRLFARAIEQLQNGPNAEQQTAGHAYIYGEVSTAHQRKLCGILRTPEPYVYTGDALLKGAACFLAHGLPKGFYTPSIAFGSTFALDVSPDATSVEFFEGSA